MGFLPISFIPFEDVCDDVRGSWLMKRVEDVSEILFYVLYSIVLKPQAVDLSITGGSFQVWNLNIGIKLSILNLLLRNVRFGENNWNRRYLSFSVQLKASSWGWMFSGLFFFGPSQGIWDITSQIGGWTGVPCIRSLNHRTAREVPEVGCFEDYSASLFS